MLLTCNTDCNLRTVYQTHCGLGEWNYFRTDNETRKLLSLHRRIIATPLAERHGQQKLNEIFRAYIAKHVHTC